MIEILDDFEDNAAGRARVVAAMESHTAAVIASRGRGEIEAVARVEDAVAADPARAFRIAADGSAVLAAHHRRYQAGRFAVTPLCALRAQALAARTAAGRPTVHRRLWVIDGASPATDIGALQATAAPGSLFQVASQFNCLESPGPFVAPVHHYLTDPTQGPRASISAFPATLLRHYAAPAWDGSRFVQRSDGEQLNLLADVCDPGIATVRNGYLRSQDIVDPGQFARALRERFESIAVGVHDGAEVVLGADWSGGVANAPHRTIAQVFASTVAGGMYGEIAADRAGAQICEQLQRAAYLGTLLAAAALGKRRVLLTLIGGGVFANPIRTIWEAILWAADQVVSVLHDDLSIVVNGRSLGQELATAELVAATRARGGALLRVDRSGLAFVD